MEKIDVSAVIIAKNEAGRIGKCLKSLSWADEIIVVDGFSTDDTVNIAASFGARVIQHKFTGSFADERNVGLDNARNDWVLQLDADDIVTDNFRDKLKDALSRKEDVAVYKFRRKNFFLGHSMDHGGFHHYIPNLVNRKRVRYQGEVHEVPVFEGNTGTLEADIEHYPFDTLDEFIRRQNRYTDIAAKEIFEKNGILPEKVINKNLSGKTFKLFWKSYVKKHGYKEGGYGLIFAVLFAFINFLKWSKYYEIVKAKKGNKA